MSVPYKSYTGENSIEKFFEAIFEEEKIIMKHMKNFRKSIPILNKKQEREYQASEICYICQNNFTKDNKKVRDHCHISEVYRGAACNRCNLKLKLSNRIPVVFHNLRGYDSHLLIQKIGKFKRPINIIPNNMKKYISFSIGTEIDYYNKVSKIIKRRIVYNLTFIDSFQFMPSSLSQLVDNLKTSGIKSFKYMSQEFKNNTEIMTRKGVYPYSFVDSWKKFIVNIKKLKIEDFKNDLTGDNISKEDFEFLKNICEKFNIKTVGNTMIYI